MRIYPGMSLQDVKRLNWIDANTLIACFNNEVREARRKREAETRRMNLRMGRRR